MWCDDAKDKIDDDDDLKWQQCWWWLNMVMNDGDIHICDDAKDKINDDDFHLDFPSFSSGRRERQE